MKFSTVGQLLSANVLLGAATFAISVLLARALDPEARGVLANIILWPTFLSHISMCGVPVYLSRKMASQSEHAAAYYRRAYTAVAFTSTLSIFLYGSLLVIGRETIVSGAGASSPLYAGLIIPFSAWNALQSQMELGRMSLRNYNFARGSFTIAYLALVAGLWAVQSREPDLYLWAFVISAAIAALSTHWLIAGSLGHSRDGHSLDETLAGTFRAAAPFALSIGFIALASSADRIAVSLFFGAQALGIYVVALALTQIQSVVNEAVSPLFFASMAQKVHIAQSDPTWLSRNLRQSILMNATICAALVAAAPVLVPLIYGQAYDSAIPLVAVLLLAMCVRGMMRPFEEVLKGINRPLGQSIAIGTVTGVFFTGAGLAAWLGSVTGVALALLAGSGVGLVVVAVLVSRERKISLSQLVVPRMSDATGLVADVRRMLGI